MTNDLRLIHTQGLDEGIRCAMCTNTIKSDKGCDGGCVVNQKIYEKVLKVIDKALEAQSTDADCINREDTLKEFKRVYFDNATAIRCAELILGSMPPVTPTNEDIKEAYLKGYDYGVKDWFKSKTQPCEDCISREEVRRILSNEVFELMKLHTVNPEDNPKADAMAYGVNWSLNTLMELPSVYPERPKGKWNFIGDQMFECSSCKRTYTQNQFEELRIYTTDDLLPKFCPNCGSYSGGGEDV